MRKILRSRILCITLIAALLFVGMSFLGAGAPTSAGGRAPSPVTPDSVPITPLSQGSPFISADLLRSETESMQKYIEALTDYSDQLESLSNNRNPDQRQIAALESKLRSLRGQAPQFQNASRSVVAKLKRAGKWTAELDSYFETSAARNGLSREIIADVKGAGGFRNFFEKLIPLQNKVSEQFDEDERKINELKLKRVGLLDRLGDFLMPTAYANLRLFAGCFYCAQFFANYILLAAAGGPAGLALLQDFKELCTGFPSRCF